MRQKGALVIGLLAFSFLPIWRCAGGLPKMNFWEYANIAFLRAPGSYPHIPIEEAIERARRAYCEVTGLNYDEQTFIDYPGGIGTGTGIPSGVG